MMDTGGTLTDAYDNFPVWSPHGDTIAFIRRVGHTFNIFTIYPDGTVLKQLSTPPGNDAHLAWSRDGTRILFTSGRMAFKDEALLTDSPQPYGEIFAMTPTAPTSSNLPTTSGKMAAPPGSPPSLHPRLEQQRYTNARNHAAFVRPENLPHLPLPTCASSGRIANSSTFCSPRVIRACFESAYRAATRSALSI
jgi:hypothetical protein